MPRAGGRSILKVGALCDRRGSTVGKLRILVGRRNDIKQTLSNSVPEALSKPLRTDGVHRFGLTIESTTSIPQATPNRHSPRRRPEREAPAYIIGRIFLEGTKP